MTLGAFANNLDTMAEKQNESAAFMFNRTEMAGSLGDLGTLIPLTAGLIVNNGLSPTSVFLWIGLFYILSGLYYRLPIPVQPLKVVAAVAIAAPAGQITQSTLAAAGLLFGAILLVLSLSGAVEAMARLFTRPVVRGIQLGLGLILAKKGILFMAGSDLTLKGAELAGPGLSTNLYVGLVAFPLILLLLNNKKLPAAIAAVVAGLVLGLALGGYQDIKPALGPTPISFYWPSLEDFSTALALLVLPQLPLTIGNAAVGTADTACSLFAGSPYLERATPRRFAMTMGLINLPAGFMGAMPMCHGAGGLAAHYRFGARTGGSNLIIGAAFLALALPLGQISHGLITLMPLAILGALLVFSGLELSLLVRDVSEKGDLFVVFLIAAAALALSNMGWAFLVGIAASFIIKKFKVQI